MTKPKNQKKLKYTQQRAAVVAMPSQLIGITVGNGCEVRGDYKGSGIESL